MTRSHPQTNALADHAIDESRRAILDAIGAAPEMTLIRPFGNFGDELIWAGTRELLSGHIYREIGTDQLPSAGGELAVLGGGGAWSRRYNEFMPEVLAIAELRFDRVIVLPSTFEVSEDRVRAALETSDAIVFARELESFGQIQGLCRARLAHDCAFFADLSQYNDPGRGELNAFRVDDESLRSRALPPDNDDISESAESLDSWLRQIERHAVVNTDRAHVMIAAARMGKQVNYAPSSYFKVEAIAEYALGDFNVRPLAGSNGHVRAPAQAGRPARLGVSHPDSPARVTVTVLSRDHAEEVGGAIDSALAESGDAHVVVLDRNSRPRTRAVLAEIAGRAPEIEFRLADRDKGSASSLRLAAELARTEYVMFLGDQMRLTPGSLKRMVAVLDGDPGLVAVTPTVTAEGGAIQHCGGWPQIDGSTVRFELTREDNAGPTGWVPSQATLFRRSALGDVPFAGGMDVECQNADWCLRIEQLIPGGLQRCPEARVISPAPLATTTGTSLVERAGAARALPAHAEFFERHGRVLADPLLELVPDLRDRAGELNTPAAEILLSLVAARGPEWTLMEWMNGGLDPLLQWRPVDGEPELSDSQRERLEWLEARNERLAGIEGGGWWQLREKLEPVIRLVRR